jgi:hypothetical protein
MHFRGWVPTVNCRLSFRIVGHTDYPTQTECKNIITGKYGYVLSTQCRDLSDVLFGRLSEWVLGVSGKFDFVIAARVHRGDLSTDAKLIGKLFLVRRTSFDHKTVQDKLSDAFLKLEECQNIPSGDSEVRKIYCEQLGILSDHADIHANFVLRRNGMFLISKIGWRNLEHEQNSESFSSAKNIDFNHIIADQFYFFVRDICHQHQHHGEDSDTITTTYKSDSPSLDWCSKILYSLYYHVINVKRKKDSYEQIRILGVLAYIQAFKHLVRERAKSLGQDPDVIIPFFDDDATKDSIAASGKYLEAIATKVRLRSDKVRAWGLGFTALALTLLGFVTGFASPDVQPNPYVRTVANSIKEQAWVGVLPIVGLILVGLSSLILNRPNELLKDVIRISLANRTIAIIALLIAASVLGYFSYNSFLAAFRLFFAGT